jgi:hypothetical protein
MAVEPAGSTIYPWPLLTNAVAGMFSKLPFVSTFCACAALNDKLAEVAATRIAELRRPSGDFKLP